MNSTNKYKEIYTILNQNFSKSECSSKYRLQKLNKDFIKIYDLEFNFNTQVCHFELIFIEDKVRLDIHFEADNSKEFKSLMEGGGFHSKVKDSRKYLWYTYKVPIDISNEKLIDYIYEGLEYFNKNYSKSIYNKINTQNTMIKDLIIKVINSKKYDKIRGEKKFYFQKAKDCLTKIKEYKISAKEIQKISLNYNNKFVEYVENLNDEKSKIFLKLIGELISYLDANAANKNEFNQYEDKRSIAKSGVNQTIWLNQFLKFKETNNYNVFTDSTLNAIKYILNPETEYTILSENHRKKLFEALFTENYSKDNFSNKLNQYFSIILEELNCKFEYEFNKTYYISCLIYDELIKNVWLNAEEYIIIPVTSKTNLMPQPLNQILYGAPGTGKTYQTKKLAVEIIDDKVYTNRTEINQRYEELKASNQIHFTTFHQSMSYEDFIEGIKPVLDNDDSPEVQYEIKNGIFKEIANRATFEIVKSLDIKELVDFNSNWDFALNYFQTTDPPIIKSKTQKDLFVEVNKNNNLVIIHSEKDKQYIVSKDRMAKLFPFKDEILNSDSISKSIKKIIGGSNYTVYFAVLKFLSENTINSNPELEFDEFTNYFELVKDKKLVISNKNATKNINKFILILDEINRGNVSSIFGELITLIENDKRYGEDEFISITLPYSKKNFFAPFNLYIIGTMNTADRSVEALDTALRRRFSFTEMQPNPSLLEIETYKEVDLVTLLETINSRIELLIDKNHQIGHAYFMSIESIDDLRITFQNKIIPLLEEYFYGDYGKIGLVLGESFIELNIEINKFKLADFKAYEDIDFVSDKKIFNMIPIKNDKGEFNWTIESFKSIYE